MRIIKLTAENVKRLRAIEISPAGDVVVISGRNGQGKTSVLDAIWYALGGGNATRGTKQPVRDGEDEAFVTLDLGDMVVTRSWKGDKTQLRVESADGARYSSPQAVLDNLVGRLSFDPLGFAQQDEKSQLETLLEVVALPFDPAELDAQRRQVFDARTSANRLVRELEAQYDGAPKAPPVTPDEEVSATSILESIKNAQDWQQLAKTRRMRLEAKQQQLAEFEKAIAATRDAITELEAEVAQLPDPLPDPATYTAQLEQLEETNRNVRAKKARAVLKEYLTMAQRDAKQLTAQIENIDKQKSDGIAAATMPVPGLGFNEDGVTYNDIPFKQASSAEQLRVSVAMAMALNPNLRVVRITDGSLLDSASMQIISDMCTENDFQCWVERVTDGDGVGIIIEDGQVVGI